MELKQLVGIVSDKYRTEIITKSRKRHIVYPKKVCCYLARELGYGLQEIGDSLQLQHDNVHYHIHSIDRIYNHDAIKCNEIIDEHKLHITNLKAKKENITRHEYESILGDLKQLNDTLLNELIETRVKPFIRLTQSRKQHNEKTQGSAPILRNRVKNPFLS
jgi:hypothetical protein